MPTRTGITTAVTAIVLLAAGRIFGIFELYVVAAAMMALVGCAALWVVLNWRALHVRRGVSPARLHAGESAVVTLNLSNHRIVPTPVAQVIDHVEGTIRADAQVPPIRRNGSTRASYRVPTQRRGCIAIGPMTTRVTDPFGLASSSRTSAPDTEILVLPRIDRVAPPPPPGGSIAQLADRSPNRVANNGEEFSALRPYNVGDDLRKVHWASTARNDEMVVRTEYVPEHGHSLVALDVRSIAADEETFEHMVSAAASLIAACHDRGDLVRFVSTAGHDLVASDARSFNHLLDLLALIEQFATRSAKLPVRVGDPDLEAGVILVGDDAETLIASIPVGAGTRPSTFIVRFHPAAGAKAKHHISRVASSRMMDVASAESFADVWQARVGLPSVAARSS